MATITTPQSVESEWLLEKPSREGLTDPLLTVGKAPKGEAERLEFSNLCSEESETFTARVESVLKHNKFDFRAFRSEVLRAENPIEALQSVESVSLKLIQALEETGSNFLYIDEKRQKEGLYANTQHPENPSYSFKNSPIASSKTHLYDFLQFDDESFDLLKKQFPDFARYTKKLSQNNIIGGWVPTIDRFLNGNTTATLEYGEETLENVLPAETLISSSTYNINDSLIWLREVYNTARSLRFDLERAQEQGYSELEDLALLDRWPEVKEKYLKADERKGCFQCKKLQQNLRATVHPPRRETKYDSWEDIEAAGTLRKIDILMGLCQEDEHLRDRFTQNLLELRKAASGENFKGNEFERALSRFRQGIKSISNNNSAFVSVGGQLYNVEKALERISDREGSVLPVNGLKITAPSSLDFGGDLAETLSINIQRNEARTASSIRFQLIRNNSFNENTPLNKQYNQEWVRLTMGGDPEASFLIQNPKLATGILESVETCYDPKSAAYGSTLKASERAKIQENKIVLNRRAVQDLAPIITTCLNNEVWETRRVAKALARKDKAFIEQVTSLAEGAKSVKYTQEQGITLVENLQSLFDTVKTDA